MARVIIPGTFAEYGQQGVPVDEAFASKPETEWAMIKSAQTNLGRVFYKQYGLPVIMARIFEMYGETATNAWVAGAASQVAQAEKRLETYPVLKPRSIQARRDLIHVDDVISALLALGEKGRPGEVYNIATNQPTDMQEVVRVLLKNARLRHFEVKPMEDLGEDLLHGRISKMDVHTGWKPKVDLETGVLRELRYWREQTLFLTADA
jgi:nucleoside-diphosphate-sugar epimerase